VNVLDTSNVRESDTLTRARSSLPYPIARAARAVQLSTDMKDTYEATLRAAEAVSIVLGITAATWARDNEITTPELEQLKEALRGRGASQGHWQKAAKSVERPMYQHPAEIPGMVDALKTGKGGSGLVADLRELLEERNLWAHGGGPHSRVEAAERTGRFLPVLEHVFEKVAFLSDVPWILVNDVKLRRRERDFHIQAARAMGDHPDFDYQELTTPQPLAEDVFYLLTPHGPVDLTPLVVMRQCPTCRQREVSYADRIDRKNGVALKTFDRGHLLFDASLTEEMLALVSDTPSQDREEAG
jgi:hypothetical protein